MIYENVEMLINQVRGNEYLCKHGKLTMNPNTWLKLMQEIKEDGLKVYNSGGMAFIWLQQPPYRYKGFEVVLNKHLPEGRLQIGVD